MWAVTIMLCPKTNKNIFRLGRFSFLIGSQVNTPHHLPYFAIFRYPTFTQGVNPKWPRTDVSQCDVPVIILSAKSIDIIHFTIIHLDGRYHCEDDMERRKSVLRHVWILARPLSTAIWFPFVGKTSDGKFHLCHWAVLVSDMNIASTRAIALGAQDLEAQSEETVLGTLYELDRLGTTNTVNICSSFGAKEIKRYWPYLSCEYVGDTDIATGDILLLGISFNCQY